MAEKILTFLASLTVGVGGYFAINFWMAPILRYRELKRQIVSDLVFFANVINADGLDDEMKARLSKRTESNRKHAAELTACAAELPQWYKRWLKSRGQSLEEAATQLVGLSNTYEYDPADQRVQRIKAALGIQTDVV
jgi:hypothetical protein